MKITIENTSSPGASFTENTNDVLIKTQKWISLHSGEQIPFIEFRKRLQSDMGINDNNNRNIFPLLRNCEIVNYESGGILNLDSFFTNNGKAYVTALETINAINNSTEYSNAQKKSAISRMNSIIAEIVFSGLKKLIRVHDTNYVEPLKDFISYICEFGSICKVEYAYFLFERKTKNLKETLTTIKNSVEDYRNKKLDFEIEVSVRNDIEIRENTNTSRRKESLSFLTSYGYFISLLSQANLIVKDDKYYRINQEHRTELESLIKED